MSRTFSEHHPTTRNPKYRFPTPLLKNNIYRKRKIKPYGLKGWCGYGGETYFRKWGEVMTDIVNKKKIRRENKNIIKQELNNI